MVQHALAASYTAFLSEAATGAFPDPVEGWSAAMILAHIAINDRRLAVITETVCAGHFARNDNADAVNDNALREYAARLGWDGLLAEVRQAGDALMVVTSAMTEQQGQQLVDTHLVDAGAVVVDDALPWSRFLLVHAQHHLPGHMRQLAALRR